MLHGVLFYEHIITIHASPAQMVTQIVSYFLLKNSWNEHLLCPPVHRYEKFSRTVTLKPLGLRTPLYS